MEFGLSARSGVCLIYNPIAGTIQIHNPQSIKLSGKLLNAERCPTREKALEIFNQLNEGDVEGFTFYRNRQGVLRPISNLASLIELTKKGIEACKKAEGARVFTYSWSSKNEFAQMIACGLTSLDGRIDDHKIPSGVTLKVTDEDDYESSGLSGDEGDMEDEEPAPQRQTLVSSFEELSLDPQ